MSIINKYPLENWVLSQDNVRIGDTIAFYSEDQQQEIHAKVLGFPSTGQRQYLTCKRADANYTEVINFYDVVVYKIESEISDGKISASISKVVGSSCSCGAKFTSNPKYHLGYCELA